MSAGAFTTSGSSGLPGTSSDTTTSPSHGTDQQEFYQLLSDKDDVDLRAKLAEWEMFYNCHRPHASLKGQMPDEILLEKLQSNPTSTEVIPHTHHH
jgi:Integrase core domain